MVGTCLRIYVARRRRGAREAPDPRPADSGQDQGDIFFVFLDLTIFGGRDLGDMSRKE